MDDAQIYSRLAGVFNEVFDDETIEVTPQLTAKDVDGWDSLTHIRLILSVEKAFKIRFTTSEIGTWKTWAISWLSSELAHEGSSP
jgi:acyl carrier protein